jgi:hypothetical protein
MWTSRDIYAAIRLLGGLLAPSAPRAPASGDGGGSPARGIRRRLEGDGVGAIPEQEGGLP